MKRVIGLTGGIASGKSTVSNRLREHGCYIADADAVSRRLLEPGGGAYAETVSAFPEYVREDGSIDRAGLGAYVFSHEEALEKLNAITHPAVIRAISEDIEDREGIIIIDAPLLIEAGLNSLCDKIWLVTADRELRIGRAMKRSGLSRKEAENRIDSQLSDEDKKKYADVVIDNGNGLAALFDRVDALIRKEMDGVS